MQKSGESLKRGKGLKEKFREGNGSCVFGGGGVGAGEIEGTRKKVE